MARATAEMLAERGAKVAILDRPSSAGEEVAAAIGADSVFHPLDVCDSASIARALDAVVERFGALHVGVNTAGGGIARRTLAKEGPHPLDDFRAVVELNLIASFDFLRLCAERMARNAPNADGERGVARAEKARREGCLIEGPVGRDADEVAGPAARGNAGAGSRPCQW